MIPARDMEEFRLFPQADVEFIKHWLEWTDENLAYLRNTRPINTLGMPALGSVDGTCAVSSNEGRAYCLRWYQWCVAGQTYAWPTSQIRMLTPLHHSWFWPHCLVNAYYMFAIFGYVYLTMFWCTPYDRVKYVCICSAFIMCYISYLCMHCACFDHYRFHTADVLVFCAGYIFLFNPNMAQMSVNITLDESIGLTWVWPWLNHRPVCVDSIWCSTPGYTMQHSAHPWVRDDFCEHPRNCIGVVIASVRSKCDCTHDAGWKCTWLGCALRTVWVGGCGWVYSVSCGWVWVVVRVLHCTCVYMCCIVRVCSVSRGWVCGCARFVLHLFVCVLYCVCALYHVHACVHVCLCVCVCV